MNAFEESQIAATETEEQRDARLGQRTLPRAGEPGAPDHKDFGKTPDSGKEKPKK